MQVHGQPSSPSVSADDLLGYLLLAGRAGGQQAIGGTGAADELQLRGSSDAALGRVSVQSPLEIDDVSAGDQIALRYRPTFTTGGPFIGGFISSAADVTYDNATFIWALLAEGTTYRAATGPGFAAFTLFNAIPTIVNAGNFDLVRALIMNVGLVHERSTSGTSNATLVVGVSFSPQCRASTSGAVLTKSVGDTAVRCAPTFSTVAGSTVNMGTIIGLDCVEPAAGLFQPSAGTENLTAYYGVRFQNITFASSGEKNALRCEMTDALDRYCIRNTGGARCDWGGCVHFNCGVVQLLGNGIGFSLSLGSPAASTTIYWNGTQLVFDPLSSASNNLLWTFGGTHNILQSSDFGSGSQLRLGFGRFAFGQTTAVGNQIGIFVAPAFTVTVAGEWHDFLLSQAGSLNVNGNAMSNVSAWNLNSRSITLSGGSITDITTLRVSGMTTSGIGAALTSALWVTGRSVFRGSINLAPITPAQLTGDVNDYQAHGTGNSQRAVVRLSSDASRNVTGFDVAISRVNDTIWAVNVGANNVVLQHQNAGSAAANRIISPTGADLTLGPDEAALLWYDDTTARWRILYTTGA